MSCLFISDDNKVASASLNVRLFSGLRKVQTSLLDRKQLQWPRFEEIWKNKKIISIRSTKKWIDCSINFYFALRDVTRSALTAPFVSQVSQWLKSFLAEASSVKISVSFAMKLTLVRSPIVKSCRRHSHWHLTSRFLNSFSQFRRFWVGSCSVSSSELFKQRSREITMFVCTEDIGKAAKSN